MACSQEALRLPAKYGISVVTHEVASLPALRECKAGVATLYLTNAAGRAAFSINENADPDVQSDLFRSLAKIASAESLGEESAVAARAAFLGPSLEIPIHDGRLALGTWQGIYLVDWDKHESVEEREILVTVEPCANVQDTVRRSIRAPKRGCTLMRNPPALPKGAGAADIGVVNFFLQHTSASLALNENADEDVQRDLANALDSIVPESWNEWFDHTDEGPDDMPAHVKCALVGPSLSLPVRGGRPLTGTWQGLYLNEHRSTATERQCLVTLSSPPAGAVAEQCTISVTAPSRGCHALDAEALGAKVEAIVAKVCTGRAHFFCKHTSASLAIAGAGDGAPLEAALNAVVPEAWHHNMFTHVMEGPDDMTAHVKQTLLGAGVSVPITDGRLVFGDGAALFLCEHRNQGGWGGGHTRQIVVTVTGNPL